MSHQYCPKNHWSSLIQPHWIGWNSHHLHCNWSVIITLTRTGLHRPTQWVLLPSGSRYRWICCSWSLIPSAVAILNNKNQCFWWFFSPMKESWNISVLYDLFHFITHRQIYLPKNYHDFSSSKNSYTFIKNKYLLILLWNFAHVFSSYIRPLSLCHSFYSQFYILSREICLIIPPVIRATTICSIAFKLHACGFHK